MPAARSSLAAALLAGLLVAVAEATEVDLELVLAVDVSRSMDEDEQALQRDGYVAAFRHAEVVRAITDGLTGRIAVTYVEWAGPGAQRVVVPWTLIDGAASAAAFAGRLQAEPISRFRGTSISGALAFATPLFEASGFTAPRQVIDVSGDGPNNMGPPVLAARDLALAAGVTINGLPIMLKEPFGFYAIPDLDIYYEDCVIGGPGAFIVTVSDPSEFAVAIRRKLVLEIAGRTPRLMPAQFTQGPRIDCMIGERLRQRWMSE